MAVSVFVGLVSFLFLFVHGDIRSEELLCKDPDTGILHKIDSTWASTTFCGKYTCKIRRKNIKGNIDITTDDYDPFSGTFEMSSQKPPVNMTVENLTIQKPTSNNTNETISTVDEEKKKYILTQYQIEQMKMLHDKLMQNEDDYDRFLTEDEIRSLIKILRTVTVRDIETVVDIYNILKEMYKDVSNKQFENELKESEESNGYPIKAHEKQMFNLLNNPANVEIEPTATVQLPVEVAYVPLGPCSQQELNSNQPSHFWEQDKYILPRPIYTKKCKDAYFSPPWPSRVTKNIHVTDVQPFYPMPYAYIFNSYIDQPYDNSISHFDVNNRVKNSKLNVFDLAQTILLYEPNDVTLYPANSEPYGINPSIMRPPSESSRNSIPYKTIEPTENYKSRSTGHLTDSADKYGKSLFVTRLLYPKYSTEAMAHSTYPPIFTSTYPRIFPPISPLLQTRMKFPTIFEGKDIYPVKKRINLDRLTRESGNRLKRSSLYTGAKDGDLGHNDYEVYIEKTECDVDIEAGYFRMGDKTKPYPECCPKKIELR